MKNFIFLVPVKSILGALFYTTDILESNQEEADTRLLLHAENASQDYPNIFINSPDTDVFILALPKCLSIDVHLYFLTVVKDKRRIIDIEAVADKAYQSIDLESCEKSMLLDALVGYHCFTGCDSVRALLEEEISNLSY